MSKCKQCPNKGHMKEHACKDKTQCWEPCGELGNDERFVRRAPQTPRDVMLKKLKKH